MKRIFLLSLALLFVPHAIFGQDLTRLFLHWMEFAGGAQTDIAECVDTLAPVEIKRALREGRKVEPSTELSFAKLVARFSITTPYSLVQRKEKKVSTHEIPKHFLDKVINRRAPMFNYHHTTDVHNWFQRGDSPYGYLEAFQIILIQQLIVNDDFRFLTEAEDLLSYLKTKQNGHNRELTKGYYNITIEPFGIILESLEYYIKIGQKNDPE